MKILILGASYGSLLSTKLAMAGHDITLICRDKTAALINSEGTNVRLKLRDETDFRIISSDGLPGKVDAITPENAKPEDYDLVALAMQEPQYGASSVRELMARIAATRRPCLSIMNMPPLPYLKRIPALADVALDDCFTDPTVWADFEPGLVTLCSPDPQAKCTTADVFGQPFMDSIASGNPDPTLIAPNASAEIAVLYATGGLVLQPTDDCGPGSNDLRGLLRTAGSSGRDGSGTGSNRIRLLRADGADHPAVLCSGRSRSALQTTPS